MSLPDIREPGSAHQSENMSMKSTCRLDLYYFFALFLPYRIEYTEA